MRDRGGTVTGAGRQAVAPPRWNLRSDTPAVPLSRHTHPDRQGGDREHTDDERGIQLQYERRHERVHGPMEHGTPQDGAAPPAQAGKPEG